MTYRPLDHTADAGVDLAAPTREALFAEALAAFTDTLTVPERIEERDAHLLSVEAPGLEELMVEWLGEALFRFEVEGLLLRRAEVTIDDTEADTGDGFRLAATAYGEPYDPERHSIKVLIKAVTYHQLKVEEHGGEWRGRVIFDI